MNKIKSFTKVFVIAVSFFFSANAAKAQYVTIPDAGFVTWLQSHYPGCMVGNQMDTTCAGLMTVTNLSIQPSGTIHDLTGIQYFAALHSLALTHIPLTSFPQFPPNLDTFSINNTNFASITSIPVLPNSIRYLNIWDDSIHSITSFPNSLTYFFFVGSSLTSLPALTSNIVTFDCQHAPITSVPTLPSNLKELMLRDGHLTSLPSLPSTLKSLEVDVNAITSLPSLPDSLQYLICGYNQLTSLPTLPNTIGILQCDSNHLTSLPTLPNGLGNLDCSSNLLTALPPLPYTLSNLYCQNNQLTSIPPLSNILQSLYCGNNLLTSLPEFPQSLWEIYIGNNPNLTCIPFLPDYTGWLDYTNIGIACLPNYPNVYQSCSPALTNYPLCITSNPNNCDYLYLSGTIYLDSNANCMLDTMEAGLHNIRVWMLDSANTILHTSYTDSSGMFVFHPNALGTYYLRIADTTLPFIFPACMQPSDTTVIVTNLTNSIVKNIPFVCRTGFDVGVFALTQHPRFVPGHTSIFNMPSGDYSSYYSHYHCGGSLAGTVTCVITGDVFYTGYNGIPPSTVDSTNSIYTITWNIADYSTIVPDSFSLKLYTKTTAIIGQHICVNVTVTPTNGDIDTTNNTRSDCFTIYGSYDPNEKQVSPEGDINPSQQWLTYTINYQNTGTAQANNIFIIDTLDSHLDPFSLQVIAYNHLPMTQVYDNGVVKFNFPNINLPDSNSNEPASHGYVQYKVKLRQQYPIGTHISNTGYIYFDYNAPVVTNTTMSTVNISTGIKGNTKNVNSVYVYPNPAKNKLTITFSSNKKQSYTLRLIDVMGRVVVNQSHTAVIGDNHCELNLSSIAKGLYMVLLQNGDGVMERKVVVE